MNTLYHGSDIAVEAPLARVGRALGQLRYKKVNHQLCIRNQEVIDTCLKYVECVELKPEKE